MEAMLVERGSPAAVAGRYKPEQYLIGPALPRHGYPIKPVICFAYQPQIPGPVIAAKN
jgi:hypothetical protein